jgi:hypothetical protein
VVSQYGDKSIIHGLENCERYRQQVKPADRMIGPAGIFNTGTNLFFQVEKENCVIKEAALSKSHSEPRKNGIRYQGVFQQCILRSKELEFQLLNLVFHNSLSALG